MSRDPPPLTVLRRGTGNGVALEAVDTLVRRLQDRHLCADVVVFGQLKGNLNVHPLKMRETS